MIDILHLNPFLTEFGSVMIFLGLLLVGVHLTRHSPLPYPAVMALGGLAISALPGSSIHGRVQLNPDIILYVVLPPLLYYAAWFTSWPEFRRNIRAVSFLAFGLVFFTIITVAAAVRLVIPAMPWSVALLLGAVLSPPDAIAATVVCRRAKVSPRLLAILEGESLVNDAGALVAFRLALAATMSGTFTLGDLVINLLVAALGGIGLGLLIGKLATKAHQRVFDDAFISLGLSLLVPYAAFLSAELFHASGVLAVVTAGIMVSRESPKVLSPVSRIVGMSVWGVLTLILNALAFTLVGLQGSLLHTVPGCSSFDVLLTASAAALTAVVATRFAFVLFTAKAATGTSFFERRSGMTFRHHLVVAWTGMRGVVSLAAVLSIPFTVSSGAPFPYRDELLMITFAVVILTLVVESLTLPWIINRLSLRAEEETAAQVQTVHKDFNEMIGVEHGPFQSAGTPMPSALSLRAVTLCRERLNTRRNEGMIGEEVFRHFEYLLDLREMSVKEIPLDDA